MNAQSAVEKAKNGAAGTAVQPLEKMITESVSQLKLALPSHMSGDRLVRIALTTYRMTPKLQQCDPYSFLGALFQSAQLGLEPNVNGESWIIPYFVKGRMMAQFQVGAYGYVKLFWNHQNAVSLQVETVHKQDQFSYDLGRSEIHHCPPPFGEDRGEAIGYYAVAGLANGGRAVKVMSKSEAVDFAKKFSKCYDKEKGEFMYGTPWREHFDAMAQKTVLKQLMKVLPKSVEIQRALTMDETVKTIDVKRVIQGEAFDLAALPNEAPFTPEEAPAPQIGEEPPRANVAQKTAPTATEIKIHQAKARLNKLTGSDEAYYTVIGSNGYEHSTEIKLEVARVKVLAELIAKIKELEAKK